MTLEERRNLEKLTLGMSQELRVLEQMNLGQIEDIVKLNLQIDQREFVLDQKTQLMIDFFDEKRILLEKFEKVKFLKENLNGFLKGFNKVVSG